MQRDERAAQDSRVRQEIGHHGSLADRQVADNSAGLSIDSEVVILSLVVNVEHIDREEQIAGVEIRLQLMRGGR